jgi:DNA polymerase III epsilon subunit-like protein
MFDNVFVIYDVESTSNRPTEDDIISLGAVLARYGSDGRFQFVDSFHSLCSTNKEIAPQAQSVHHISKSMIEGKPKFDRLMAMFKKFLQKHLTEASRTVFVAHNGSKFDDVILFCNCVRNDIVFDDFLREVKCHGFVDTLKMLRAMFKGAPAKLLPRQPDTDRVSFALGCCHASFTGENIQNAHDALADSRALLNVMNAPSVCARMNTVSLFSHVVQVQKAVGTIKQAAGVAFQRGRSRAQARVPPPSMGPNMDPNEGRMCLHCMTFVGEQQTHTVCAPC